MSSPRSRLALAFIALALIVVVPGRASATGPFEQPLLKQWDHKALDIIVIPPEHGQLYNGYGVLGGPDANELNPFASSYMKAIEKAIADWNTAVATFGSPSFRAGWHANHYVLGRDVIPANTLARPDIVVVSDEDKAIFLGESFFVGPSPCFSTVAKAFEASFSFADMYNIAGHEIGHCLGLNHSTGPEEIVSHDIMYATYAHLPGEVGTHLHCPSNLNVAGLQLAYDPASDVSAIATVPAESYRHMRC